MPQLKRHKHTPVIYIDQDRVQGSNLLNYLRNRWLLCLGQVNLISWHQELWNAQKFRK